MKLAPHLDQIVSGLDSFLWIDPTRNEDEIMARPDMTANQVKKTILDTICIFGQCVFQE